MRALFNRSLSKFNLFLNFNPVIQKPKSNFHYIPKGYLAALTITADFELAWAWRYSKQLNASVQSAETLGRIERANIPTLLGYCEKHNIPITWATVGHLFLESCSIKHGKKHPEIPEINPYQGTFWNFNGIDWFEHDPCGNYKENPEWYAPDLIKLIIESPINHEIGCHTFSHIDCRNEVCSRELFDAEIINCRNEASKLGLTLKSFVHPGHTIGNLDSLSTLGFTSYQTDPGNILGYPVKHTNGLWELRRTYELVYRPEWSKNYHIKKYKKIIDKAIASNSLCNFWFHPSFSPVFLNEILPFVMEHIESKRDRLWIGTVGEYVEWLNNRD